MSSLLVKCYDLLPFYFTLGCVSCNLVIPTHYLRLSVASYILLSFSANQQKAFISPHVKICTQLTEKHKNYSALLFFLTIFCTYSDYILLVEITGVPREKH